MAARSSLGVLILAYWGYIALSCGVCVCVCVVCYVLRAMWGVGASVFVFYGATEFIVCMYRLGLHDGALKGRLS